MMLPKGPYHWPFLLDQTNFAGPAEQSSWIGVPVATLLETMCFFNLGCVTPFETYPWKITIFCDKDQMRIR